MPRSIVTHQSELVSIRLKHIDSFVKSVTIHRLLEHFESFNSISLTDAHHEMDWLLVRDGFVKVDVLTDSSICLVKNGGFGENALINKYNPVAFIDGSAHLCLGS
jgi:hypothetical protein